jgi:hypothetical protein
VRSGSSGVVVRLDAAGLMELHICWGDCEYGFHCHLDTVRIRLQPGTYDIRIDADGFEAAEVNGVAVAADRETVVGAEIVPKPRDGKG